LHYQVIHLICTSLDLESLVWCVFVVKTGCRNLIEEIGDHLIRP